MELYQRIISLLDANLIYCLIPMIATLILVELFFKNKFETRKALNVVKWIIIGYATLTLVYFIVGLIRFPDEYAFVQRATGPYKYMYWMMLFCSTILPFSLLYKRLSKRFLYVLLVAFCLKIGMYFERFVIIVTSLHRDYPKIDNNSFLSDPLAFGWAMITIQGMTIALLLLGFFALLNRKAGTQ